MRWPEFVIAVCLCFAGANAQPLVGPWPIEEPTEVVVLGTPHLSGIDHLQPEWLTPLLDRLAQWQPQIIAIEGLSGPECYLLRSYERSWPDTADSYCRSVERVAALGARATGLTMQEAEAEVEVAVARLAPESPPEDRRRMAALFAAAGNLGSAAVQWLRLPPDERRASESMDAELATALDQLSTRRNENYWIAAVLAARLGLERVYPTDDHLSDRVQAEAPSGLEEAMREIWSGPRPPLVQQMMTMESGLNDPASVMQYYQFLNRPDVAEAFVRADMGKAYVTPSAANHGRRYVAWWEARNLRMVANIRQALGRHPGARGLVIVGSTHKPYLDAYLQLMHEVRLIPTSQVIGSSS
ncbi:MAG TPA: DUF5694 domain-containing protein [Allosphingosinicella sp.]|nr:DUF5694 domain-containing protein [Allosphingosinicella sp.]